MKKTYFLVQTNLKKIFFSNHGDSNYEPSL